MSSAPKSAQEDDVSRLFKQLDLAAFRFRSFDRPGGDGSDGDNDGSEFQTDTGSDAAVAATPTLALPPAAPPALPPSPPSQAAAAVDAAFNRLLRQGDSRQQRLPGFRLALPRPPRVIEQTRTAGHELSISEVLNRLYRLGGSKVSLIRQRGEA